MAQLIELERFFEPESEILKRIIEGIYFTDKPMATEAFIVGLVHALYSQVILILSRDHLTNDSLAKYHLFVESYNVRLKIDFEELKKRENLLEYELTDCRTPEKVYNALTPFDKSMVDSILLLLSQSQNYAKTSEKFCDKFKGYFDVKSDMHVSLRLPLTFAKCILVARKNLLTLPPAKLMQLLEFP